MRIEEIVLDDYIDSPTNSRVMYKEGDPVFESISQSIDQFDFLQPLIVNEKTSHIIAGHLRKRVLKSKGIDKAMAVIVSFDILKEKAAVLAFNKISGSWDYEKLSSVLDELSKTPSFDVSITGFNVPEISEILDRYSEPNDDSFDFDAAVAAIKEPITKKGDLIQLGRHRLLCGDSADIEDMKRLMQDEKASLLVTDPPYLASYMPGNRPTKNGRRTKGDPSTMIQNDHMPQEEYEKWLKTVLGNVTQFLEGSSSAYIWNGFRQFGPMTQMLIDLGFHISNVITWVKPSLCISYSDYNFQSEFCIYAWREGQGPHRWFGSPKESNVWHVARDSISSRIHQNQKPIELAQRALKNSSSRGEIVLEPFAGSGWVTITAEQLDRRCYGIEIDPTYCDAIVRRYIAYIGIDKAPEHLRKKYLTEVAHG